MSARVFLTPKTNSFVFEDRLLVLDSPVKVGRSHKDDRSESGNAYYDCKVLSRAHAVIMFEEGKFVIIDTGSSNGSFVNNIRLSKSGEESKPTQLYSGDNLRFGSDVLDKSKNVTQKCIVAKLKLFYPDGQEHSIRPSSSRLYRPTDSLDDIQILTVNLQEALIREKLLEDRLSLVSGEHSSEDLEKVLVEKDELVRRLEDIEKKMEDKEQFVSSVIIKQEDDKVEIAKLRQLIDNQNVDLASLETALGDTQGDLERVQGNSNSIEERIEEVKNIYEEQIKAMEDTFNEERTKMRQQIHDVSTNEINLLNRIKSLESDQGYARAEVDKIVVKDADSFQYKQELEYKVECLSTELEHTKMMLESVEANKVVERSEDDINTINEQEDHIAKLKEEVSYIKKELIDSRSRKAAAEDELNTVKGTIETMTNSAHAQANDIESLNISVKTLTDKMTEASTKSNHLENLVNQMEQEPDVDAKSKVEIADQKTEIASCQLELKSKLSEIVNLKDAVRLEQETIQQKEIDISRLEGKVQFVKEELEHVKEMNGGMDSLQVEVNTLRNKLNLVVDELEMNRGDNVTLSNELQQQQMLYSELKKMRGRGEEMDLLQQVQKDVVVARDMAEEYHAKWQETTEELSRLTEEKMRVLRENAQLRSNKLATDVQTVSQEQTVKTVTHGVAVEAVMTNIGSLKLYEILFGLLFLTIIVSWNPYTLPL